MMVLSSTLGGKLNDGDFAPVNLVLFVAMVVPLKQPIMIMTSTVVHHSVSFLEIPIRIMDH